MKVETEKLFTITLTEEEAVGLHRALDDYLLYNGHRLGIEQQHYPREMRDTLTKLLFNAESQNGAV